MSDEKLYQGVCDGVVNPTFCSGSYRGMPIVVEVSPRGQKDEIQVEKSSARLTVLVHPDDVEGFDNLLTQEDLINRIDRAYRKLW